MIIQTKVIPHGIMEIINNLTELKAFANKFAKKLLPGSIVGLIGDLGTGKTQLTKFMVQSLGGDISEISSPTFTIINEYLINESLKVYHFDLYRLKSIEELEEIGYEDFFFSGNISIIEWIDNIPECIDMATNLIKIEYLDFNSRKLTILK